MIFLFLGNAQKKGTEECPVKSVVNRVAVQLAKALQNKGMALLVNHGISEEKVDCVKLQFRKLKTHFYDISVESWLFTFGRVL